MREGRSSCSSFKLELHQHVAGAQLQEAVANLQAGRPGERAQAAGGAAVRRGDHVYQICMRAPETNFVSFERGAKRSAGGRA